MTPASAGIPPAEVEIDDATVRRLLLEQHPDLAELPVRLAATGWDNATYRLGETLAVRLPRIHAAVDLIRHEQHWLPQIAASVTGFGIQVPVPTRIGQPSARFPWPWSVVPWVPGKTAAQEPLSDAAVGGFGRFLAALHCPAPAGFPRNGYRGVPLRNRVDDVEPMLNDPPLPRAMSESVRIEAVRQVWDQALQAPIDVEDARSHGDLHPRNIVTRDGQLAAVIDWGDMTAGDPATDLAAAWMLFPTAAHDQLWREYGQPSDATIARARGWAIYFGLSLLRTGAGGDAALSRIGLTILSRLTETIG